MQNRIDQLFKTKKNGILSIFLTAGYPKLDDTMDVIQHLNTAGIDLIEIGIPYSDPIADGPVIQNSSQTALNNGMNVNVLFEQLKNLRSMTQLPVLLMGYLNCVVQYGIEAFYKKCSEVGIDGLILPDLPMDEFNNIHKLFAERYNIHVVFLISPETAPARIKQIDALSKGFIYLVSSNSTTGSGKGVSEGLKNTFKILNALHLKNPILIGFGIKGRPEFEKACESASGAIIGTSFIQMLGSSSNFEKDIPAFISSVKQPILTL